VILKWLLCMCLFVKHRGWALESCWCAAACGPSPMATAAHRSLGLSHLVLIFRNAHRVMTAQRGNDDFVRIAPGETISLLDATGPGTIYAHLDHDCVVREISPKETFLRMFWDDETLPSVEAPVGDLFGLGLGDYFQFDSVPLSVAPR